MDKGGISYAHKHFGAQKSSLGSLNIHQVVRNNVFYAQMGNMVALTYLVKIKNDKLLNGKNSQPNMVFSTIKRDHDYCRVFTRSISEYDGRQGILSVLGQE